jgi:hypothetical protein
MSNSMIYLYDWQTGAAYLDMMSQGPYYYMPATSYQQPTTSMESFTAVEEPARESARQQSEASEVVAEPALKRMTRKRDWRCRPAVNRSIRSHHKKNIRNIIPNLARKILGFMCSEDSRSILRLSFPELSESKANEYYRFIQQQKSSLSFYIGNRDLARIWYNPEGQPEFLRIARVLSKWFLENECATSIVLSRRMKASLKIEHLRYRHKILAILKNGGTNQHNIAN